MPSVLLLCAFFSGFAASPALAYTPANGLFAGLFYEDGYWEENSGTFTLKSTGTGKYSGKLQIGTGRYSFSGYFDSDGRGAHQILRRDGSALYLDFQVDTMDPDLIWGTLSDGVWTADLIADRAVFNGKTVVCPDAGQYTMVLLGDYTSTNTPGGHSFGTIKVSKSGRVKLSGYLADGMKVTQSANVSKGGQWPFYIPVYKGWGAIYGWLLFNASAEDHLSGELVWVKPANWDWYYPDGFAMYIDAVGSHYQRPPSMIRILDLTDAAIEFNGGDLNPNLTNHLFLNADNRISNLGPGAMSMKFSLGNGSFKGQFLDPASSDWIPFRGVVLQNANVAAGCFPGWDESGEVWLEQW